MIKNGKKQNVKPIVESLVNLYLFKALISSDNAEQRFNKIVTAVNGLAPITSEEGLFLSRFKKWCSKSSNKLDDMDNFFEGEDFYWEDYYVGPN